MRQVIVQYELKKDRVEEHEALIRAVFAELVETAPEGIQYGAFRQQGGVRYVHVAFVHAKKNPLDAVAAFKAFTARIGERCVAPPEVVELTPIGTFGF
ncbi:MAG TPA: hypothetical protein VGG39_26760 [Polyangiaceae bacterium]|jgi:hypothetical protein